MDMVRERLLCICRKFCHSLFAVSFLLCAGVAAHAQSSSTGDIRGTVTDPSGAVVPGATVSVMNINTGEEKIFKTNRDGIYDTVSTPNGHYTVTITASGFESLVLGPITLDVGAITLNGHLRVGSAEQRIVVTADTASLLRTESGEQSTTLDAKTMLQLPQVGQDWANFTILLPGSAGASSTGNQVANPGVICGRMAARSQIRTAPTLRPTPSRRSQRLKSTTRIFPRSTVSGARSSTRSQKAGPINSTVLSTSISRTTRSMQEVISMHPVNRYHL